MPEHDPNKDMAALISELVTLRAERQQAIDERDAARKALKGTEKALASTTSELEETEDAFAAERARCEQAIDALRMVAAANPAVNTCNCINIARAALLSLGEQP